MARNRQSAVIVAVRTLLAAVGLLFSTFATANISANILFYQSRFADLEVQMEQEVRDISKAATTDLLYLCSAYFQLKKYNKLFPCLNQWERNAASGDVGGFMVGGDITWMLYVYRAEASMEFGDYPGAVRHARFAYDYVLQKRIGDKNKFFPLSALSLAYALNGEREKALETAQLLDNLGDTIGAMLSVRIVGLAKVYLVLGDIDKCNATMSQESGRRGLIGGITHSIGVGMGVLAFHELPKYFIASKCLFESGDSAQAKAGYDGLLANPQTATMGGIYWQLLFDRGRIAEREGKPAEALEYYRKAVEVIEQQRSTINTEASKIGFVGDKQAVYGRLVAVLIEQGGVVEAFDYVERSKSRALVDMLASKKDFAAPDTTQARLMLARLDAADLNSRIQDAGMEAAAKSAGVRNLQIAQQALQSTAPELSTLVTVSSVSAAEIKALVGADETLIEYYYEGNDAYAFLLDRERLLALRLDESDLAGQVQSLRKAMEETESSAWQQDARALYQRLWQPLEKLVTSTNIVVVAHGALHYLPFAALQDGEGRFLVDRHSLRFLPSASVLKYLHPVMRQKDAQLLALGNPDLGDPKLDLAFAEGEAKLVASLYPNSRVLLRKDASESNLMQAGSVFSRIHFASHGKFQAAEPLKSGLYLARDADNDGVLTVGELYSMNLETDLVTLSACETGLGKISNGDDVVGLTRGFLYAGSRSIVASLWSVDDQATATLMQTFHANLATLNKREALRQAQIKARETFPHPFFWAAFQLTGRAE